MSGDQMEGEMAYAYEQSSGNVSSGITVTGNTIDAASAAEQDRERALKMFHSELEAAEQALSALNAEREQKMAEWERREGAVRQVIGVCRHGLDSPMQDVPKPMAPDPYEQVRREPFQG